MARRALELEGTTRGPTAEKFFSKLDGSLLKPSIPGIKFDNFYSIFYDISMRFWYK